MRQLTLFDTGEACSICNTDPGIGANGILFNGFYDADTGEKVCWKCRDKHYEIKNRGPYANRYSEMPLVISMNLHQKKSIK